MPAHGNRQRPSQTKAAQLWGQPGGQATCVIPVGQCAATYGRLRAAAYLSIEGTWYQKRAAAPRFRPGGSRDQHLASGATEAEANFRWARWRRRR